MDKQNEPKIKIQPMTRTEFFKFILLLDRIETRLYAKRVFVNNAKKFGIDVNKISDSIVASTYINSNIVLE
jgi:hypothetical protein